MAAGENLELAGLQFENHRTCNPRLFARGSPKLLCELPDHWFGFCQRQVVLKSILDGNRLGRPVWNHFTVVDSARELMQAQTIAAKPLFERLQIQLPLYSLRR